MKQFLLLVCFMGTLAVSAQQKPSTKDKERVEFKLHPNPVHDGVVFIESDLKGPKTVRIFDIFGKMVLERHLSDGKLNLGALIPGVYMVQLYQNGHRAIKKLVVR